MPEKYNIPKENSLDSLGVVKSREKEINFEALGFKHFQLTQETELSTLFDAVSWRRHDSARPKFVQSDLQDWLKSQEEVLFADIEDLKSLEDIQEGEVFYTLANYKKNYFLSRQMLLDKEFSPNDIPHLMWREGLADSYRPDNQLDRQSMIIKWEDFSLSYKNSKGVGEIKWLEKMTHGSVAEGRYPTLRFVEDYIATSGFQNNVEEGILWMVENGGRPLGYDGNSAWVSVKKGKSINGERLLQPFINSETDMPLDQNGDRLFNGITSELKTGLYLPIGSHILFKT